MNHVRCMAGHTPHEVYGSQKICQEIRNIFWTQINVDFQDGKITKAVEREGTAEKIYLTSVLGSLCLFRVYLRKSASR